MSTSSPLTPHSGDVHQSVSLDRLPTRNVDHKTIRMFSIMILLAFVLGWTLSFYPFDDLLDRNGTPYGADFAMFYTAGSVVLNGDGDDLYNQAIHQETLQSNFRDMEDDFCLPYRYPPLVAYVMTGLASLPYHWAATLFMLSGIASAILGLWLLYSSVPGLASINRASLFFPLLCCPLVFESVIGGQGSLFAFFIVSAAIALMTRQQYVWAGAVLALALYKPNVLFFLVIGCCMFRPRVLIGLIPAALGMLGLTWLLVGTHGIWAFVNLSTSLASSQWSVETPYWKVHGLTPLLAFVVGTKAKLASVGLGVIATIVVALKWRSIESGVTVDPTSSTTGSLSMIPYSLLLTINALGNPYTPIYDLSLLLAGFVVMIPYLMHHYPPARCAGAWKGLVLTIWFGPHLSQAISMQTGLQIFSLALLVLLAIQFWRFWSVNHRPLTPAV